MRPERSLVAGRDDAAVAPVVAGHHPDGRALRQDAGRLRWLMAGDLYIVSDRDEWGPIRSVGPMPGHETEFERLNDMRMGLPMPIPEITALLDRWASRAAVDVQ